MLTRHCLVGLASLLLSLAARADVHRIAVNDGVEKLLVHEGYVYWTGFNRIARVPVGGGDVETLLDGPYTATQSPENRRDGRELAVGGGRFFWNGAKDGDPTRYYIFGTLLSGGGTEAVWTGDRYPTNLAYHEGELFFSVEQPWTPGMPYRVDLFAKDLTTGRVREVAPDQPNTQRLLVTDGWIYATQSLSIVAIPIAGGEPRAIGGCSYSCYSQAAAHGHMTWTNWSPYGTSSAHWASVEESMSIDGKDMANGAAASDAHLFWSEIQLALEGRAVHFYRRNLDGTGDRAELGEWPASGFDAGFLLHQEGALYYADRFNREILRIDAD